MGRLLVFLFKYRTFFLFLLLELICIPLIVSNNDYQRSVYINSASNLIGVINEKTNNINEYLELRSVNRKLAEENEQLRILLKAATGLSSSNLLDSHHYTILADPADTMHYIVRAAEIIKNDIHHTSNFFMINKGAKDGIRPEMGVVNSFGVVGKIRAVSKNYAQGISLLNIRNTFSAKHWNSGRIGTVQWDGKNPKIAQLLFITPDVKVQRGDTVVTSSYNAIFPKNMMIGIVKNVTPGKENTYLDINISLSADFGKLSYVYVIENIHKHEQDSLHIAKPAHLQ